ncbi:MAG: hypothetical protein Q8O84_00160, partial [Nanoarchaeota archaeon]|nr:hypothetical protein [Nanoarchaeota archaeon]
YKISDFKNSPNLATLACKNFLTDEKDTVEKEAKNGLEGEAATKKSKKVTESIKKENPFKKNINLEKSDFGKYLKKLAKK